jgi:hypothetical protein
VQKRKRHLLGRSAELGLVNVQRFYAFGHPIDHDEGDLGDILAGHTSMDGTVLDEGKEFLLRHRDETRTACFSGKCEAYFAF